MSGVHLPTLLAMRRTFTFTLSSVDSKPLTSAGCPPRSTGFHLLDGSSCSGSRIATDIAR